MQNPDRTNTVKRFAGHSFGVGIVLLLVGTAGSGANPDHQQLVRLLGETRMRLPHYLVWIPSTGSTLLNGLSVFMLGIATPLLTRDMTLDTSQTGLLAPAGKHPARQKSFSCRCSIS